MSKCLGYILIRLDNTLVKDQYENVIVFSDPLDAVKCGTFGIIIPLIKYNKPRTKKKSTNG